MEYTLLSTYIKYTLLSKEIQLHLLQIFVCHCDTPMHLFCVMFSFILNLAFILVALAQLNQIVEYFAIYVYILALGRGRAGVVGIWGGFIGVLFNLILSSFFSWSVLLFFCFLLAFVICILLFCLFY